MYRLPSGANSMCVTNPATGSGLGWGFGSGAGRSTGAVTVTGSPGFAPGSGAENAPETVRANRPPAARVSRPSVKVFVVMLRITPRARARTAADAVPAATVAADCDSTAETGTGVSTAATPAAGSASP